MRILPLFALCAAGLLAQVAAPPPQNPAVPPVPPVVGQPLMGRPQPGTPVQPVSPDTVVAKLNGKPLTAADVDKILGDFPTQIQMTIAHEPQKFLQQLMMFEELSKEGEQAGLDKQSPYRQELAYRRMMTLAQAEADKYRNAIVVSQDQEKQYYETNKEAQYRVVKAKVILVSFSPAAPAAATPPVSPAGLPKPPPAAVVDGAKRTEAEAKAKIDDLRKQLDAGADFAKLAKDNSDDKTSAAKDGDYGDIGHTSPYPEAIKKAIFALKIGEVSEPIRQPGGFYLIKAADSSYKPFDQVHGEIHNTVVGQEFQKHLDSISDQFKIEIEDRNYFAARPPK
jgi:parvulin-like peptidyl-prolyl isomerase